MTRPPPSRSVRGRGSEATAGDARRGGKPQSTTNPTRKPSRHSRPGRRFSGLNVHPESTTPPSFPRTREPRINKARLFPHPGDHCETPVIPADASASADGTCIQNQQRPRHSRARASSFPRTRALQRTKRPSRINNAPVIPAPEPRHSRGRGNPESIKHAFSPIPATIAKPPSFRRKSALQRTERPSIGAGKR